MQQNGGGRGGKFLEQLLFIYYYYYFKPREENRTKGFTKKKKWKISLCFPFLRADFPVFICHRKWHLLLMGLP